MTGTGVCEVVITAADVDRLAASTRRPADRVRDQTRTG